MKNALSLIGIITITAIIGFAFTACTDEAKSELPALTGAVTITGNAQVGEMLTANTSALGGTGTISYQWKRGSTPIGENKNTYDVQTSDVGSTITVTVTRAGYSGSVVSGATAVVTNHLPVLTGSVSISVNAQVGQKLTAHTDNLNGEGTISYQWKRGGTADVGINNSEYTVQSGDVGSFIVVIVTRSGYSGSVTSNQCVIKQGTEGLAYMLIRGNSEYSVSLGTARATGEIVIPVEHNGLPVTMIANDGFASCSNMTSIIIPDSITEIGSGAFSGCSSLTSVVLPENVTSIGANAFNGCTGLIRVTFLSVITAGDFSTTAQFPGDLRAKYLAEGVGTYSRQNGTVDTWTGAPTGLTVTGATSNSISLSWNEVAGADGYRVYRSESADGVFVEVGTSSTNSFTNTGLTVGTAYFYKVAAHFYNGMNSPQSNIFNAATILGIPANVSAVITSSTSITVSWSHVEGATGYRVYRSTVANGTFESVGTSATTLFTDIEQMEGLAIYYRVAAYNINGEGSQSSNVRVALLNIIEVSAGRYHTMAIATDGTLWAWGYNYYGQLGDGTTTDRTSPVRIGLASNWASVSASSSYTVAIATDGTLWAWGSNSGGQLGGPTTSRSSPVRIGTENNWASVSVCLRGKNDTSSHAMAITTDGSLWAWGGNDEGQLGDGTTTNRASPVRIGLANNWASVSAGGDHTVAIATDGTLWAWGSNWYGQLGDGTGGGGVLDSSGDKLTPVQIGTTRSWSSVSAGISYTVAIRADGTLWAWGSNSSGQLGDSYGTTTIKTPVRIGAENNWVSVSAGWLHTVAIATDGTLWAWGYNSTGQLGDGTTTDRLSPVQIP